jgi:translin
MQELEAIGERVRQWFEEKNKARDRALRQCRTLVRHSATAIRAVHRREWKQAQQRLKEAKDLVESLRRDLKPYPDLYRAGYAWDGRKEYAEASITYALIHGDPLPEPEKLDVEYDAYMAGLGETVGELRRQTLDLLRRDEIAEAERLLLAMDEIYALLVTIDFPDAITGNLRRITDVARGVTERTRGDLTTTFQQRELRAALRSLEEKLDGA